MEKTVPDAKDAPILISISDKPLNNLNTMCYVDGNPIFGAHGMRALLLLLAVYWIFQIQFPPDTKQQLAFIAVAVLRDVAFKEVDKNILNKITLTNALRDCNLLPTSSTDN